MAHLKGEAKARYVAAMFARISRRYDLLNTVITGGMHHRWRRLAATLAAEGLAGHALDVATGTGELAFALARQPGIQSVVGVDFVPEMVTLARHKARLRNVSHRVTFARGDALALPFDDGSFACAAAGFTLRNVTDVPAALAEMARVVRPGGRVAVLETTPFERNGPLSRLVRLYFHGVVPVVGGVLARDREAYSYLIQSADVFPRATELARLMEEAGFQRVRYRTVAMGAIAIHVGEKGRV